MKNSRLSYLLWTLTLGLFVAASALGAPVKVVTTLPVFAAIAEAVGGSRVEVESIARGDEDAHFVKPKPSYALMLRDADLFVTTGLDLEVWAPVLLDKAGNRTIREGQPGWVSASLGIPMLDVPALADRSAGDVHIFGNPHIHTSPLNGKVIARNITAGLARVDPAGAAAYTANLAEFEGRIDRAVYGPRLLEVLSAEELDPLARDGRLFAFLESQQYQGAKLSELLGGWLALAAPLRGQPIVAYHKNWIYLTELLGLEVVDYVEPKPGIPPSARHVHDLIGTISERRIRVLLAADYFSPQQVATIAERTGCVAVRVPMGPLADGPVDYLSLVDLWVTSLTNASVGGAGGAQR